MNEDQKSFVQQRPDLDVTEIPVLGIESLPESLKARIARKSREKGSNYERTVAKKIAGYFGFKWDDAFFRTKPHGHAQPDGDIKPINEMQSIWKRAGLGPLECKNRKEWSFGQLFKNPEKSLLLGYWTKSNEDTNTTNTVVIFTKPGVSDFVLYALNGDFTCHETFLTFECNDRRFVVHTLVSFLKMQWPDPQSLL